MKSNDEQLIAKFLSQELTPEEKQQFRERMDDPDFFDKLTLEMSEIDGNNKLKSRLRGLKKEVHKENRIKRQVLAASFVALFGLASIFLFLNDRNNIANPGDIYYAYFEPYPNTLNIRQDDESSNSTFKMAMEAYDSKDYATARTYFSELDENSVMAELYHAISLMELNEFEQATSLLQESLEKEKKPLQYERNWYLALAFIKQGKVEKSKEILDKISESSNEEWHEKSAQLLDDLRKK